MKIAINKRLCSTESKPKTTPLVGGLQNQRVTAEIYLSSAASPLLSNFQIGTQIFHTIFTFQRIFICRMFKLVLHTFWVSSRGELGAFNESFLVSHCKGLFTWRWGTPGRWGNPLSRGRKIKRIHMQSYYPGVLGWGFLRLLLRLQLRSLSRGIPSSHLEKDESLILGHICIYSWKRHALCYAVFDFARNRWLNTLHGKVWETKYGRFTMINILKCEHFTLLVCPLRFLVISAMRRQGNVQKFKRYMCRFWAFCHECDPG